MSGWCDQATLNAKFHVMECSYAYLFISAVLAAALADDGRVRAPRGGFVRRETPFRRILRFGRNETPVSRILRFSRYC